MKIECKYCGSAFDAMSEKCPNCGAANEQASKYANQHEQAMRIKAQARQDAYESAKQAQNKFKKIMFAIYGTVAVVFVLPMIVGIILAINNNITEGQERVEREKQKQEQIKAEQLLKEEQEKQQKAYEEEEIAVSGINTIVQKEGYYSIQVTEVVPYELNYDHNVMDWGWDNTSAPHLYNDEHRVAVHIKVKNFQDHMSLYNNPTGMMKLYIEDENADSIVIQEKSFLNGDNGDNYYSGGMMISGNSFADNYGKSLEKNQTMSWWVPVVVNENSEKIILHFDYNMSITVDNPCYIK